MNTFKKKNPLKKRINDSHNVIEKYPERTPIIVQKNCKSEIQEIDKIKYLVPKDMTISQFTFVIRKRIKLDSSQAIFITINGKLVTPSTTVGDMYRDEKDEDGFLYVMYSGENTFG